MPPPATAVPAAPQLALLKHGCGIKASIEEVEDLTRSVLKSHGGPDIKMLHSQLERGRVDPEKLEASWEGHRTEQLKWLSQMFETNMLKDEWFLATVALLDRAEAAKPRFSQKKSLKIDTLTAVLVILKLYEVEDVFDCELGALLPHFARLSSSNTWDEIVRAETTLYQLLDWHVCLATVDEFAFRIALDLGLLASDTCPEWRGIKHMRFSAPGLEPSVPQPCFIVLLYYIMELCVVHAPELVHQNSSPAIVALAALRLAMENFGSVPQACADFLKQQEDELLKADEAAVLATTLEKIRKLWQSPPAGSAVKAKWSDRLKGSNSSHSTAGALGFLGPADSAKIIPPASPKRQVRSTGIAQTKVDGVDQRSSSTSVRLSGKSNGNARAIRHSGKSGNDREQRAGAKSDKPGKPCSSNNKASQNVASKKGSAKRMRASSGDKENQTPNSLEPQAKKVHTLPSLLGVAAAAAA